MIECWISGVAVRGPGLGGWAVSQAVLAGDQPYVADEGALPPPSFLSATERRRTGPVTRLALLVAQEACEAAGMNAGSLRAVFGSSNGDGAVVTSILETLSSADPQVSPTQFHNSVHNAVAGYWTIGAGSARPVTCLGGHDGTFAAALLKAAAEARVEQEPVLLCAYDVPLPEPLASRRPTSAVFGVGLVLTPGQTSTSMAGLRVAYEASQPSLEEGAPRLPALRALSRSNPAARSLRLLEALASGEADAFRSEFAGGALRIQVTPQRDNVSRETCSTTHASDP